MGATGTGKTAFLNSFINLRFQGDLAPSTDMKHVCSSVEDRYLVLTEIPESIKDSVEFSQCDAVCILYDTKDSRMYIDK